MNSLKRFGVGNMNALDQILKAENIHKEHSLQKLFKAYVQNDKLFPLLEKPDIVYNIILTMVEQQAKGKLVKLNTTWLESRLIDILRRQEALKRKAKFIQLTEEHLEMFIDTENELEKYEQYEYILVNYGQNIADFAIGKIDLKELQEKEGVSRATLYRKLQRIKEEIQ